MKYVYAVVTGSYHKRIVLVCQDEDDAKRISKSVNDGEENSDDYVIEVPYLCDDTEYSVNDLVEASVDAATSAYQAACADAILYLGKLHDSKFDDLDDDLD
jgi:hypothetical protein